MRKKIAFIFYKIIIFIDFLIFKIYKKNFRYYLYDYLRSDSYSNVEDNNFKIKLFTPSSVSKSRAEKFFSKEPGTIEWINNFNLPDNEKIIFWDIGSNIGTFSIYAAKKHSNIEVYSFEPSTSNLGLLSKNISLNDLNKKININPLPLSNESNKFLLMNEKLFVEGGAQNTFGEDYDFEGKKFTTSNSYNILGTSIDNLIDNNILKVPNYIKIDVDGIEHLILKGASKALKNVNIKSILVEINESFEDQYTGVKNILKESGFEETSKFHSSSKKDKSQKYSMIYNYIFYKK
jgi:FkbM family methyltransferase